ncbi:WD40 repeat domain-containing protein [Aeoliella sp.]|uniref:WD40 repeat domain-containing protein n=1 Tax=Aeoliella sp. TaxID=2795800 RepID=UPI003CCB918B
MKRFVVVAVLVFALSGAATADEPADVSSNDVDLHGDPLPMGVVTRMDPERQHQGYVIALATSPDGKRTVTGSTAGEVFEWETDTGKFLRQLPGTENCVRCLEFTPDGTKLVIAGEARKENRGFCGEVLVWDLTTGEKLWGRELDARVKAAAISSDGSTLALAEGVGKWRLQNEKINQVEVLKLESGEVLKTYTDVINQAVAAAFADADQVVRVIDHRGVFYELPLATTEEPTIRDRTSGGSFVPYGTSPHGDFALACKTLTPSINPELVELRVLRRKGTVMLIDTATGDEKWAADIGFDRVRTGAFAPDGKLVATEQISPQAAGGDVTLAIRSGETGKLLWAFPVEDYRLYALRFTPDSKRLVGGTNRGHTMVWDLSMIPVQ